MTEAAAPQPISDQHVRKPISADMFMDADFDVDADDTPAAPASRSQRVAKPSPAERALAEADEPAEAEEPASEPEEAVEEPEPEPDEDLLPAGKGTQENPLTLKDLPTDKFVKVKVDGEEQVVDLRDAVSGYMRQQFFDRSVSKANEAVKEAMTFAQKAVQERETFRANFDAFIADPSRMLKFYLDNHEGTLEAMAVEYAKLRQAEQQDPTARQRRELEARQRKLAEEEQARRAKWEAEDKRRQLAARAEETRRTLEPAYKEGLKLAGFPQVTQELRDEITVRVERARRRDGKLTPEAVTGAVLAAAKFLQAQSATPKPAPAPKAAPRPTTTTRRKEIEPERPRSATERQKLFRNPDFWFPK